MLIGDIRPAAVLATKESAAGPILAYLLPQRKGVTP